MANPKRRLSTNVAGDFFVDDTCIDCDACRQIAPEVFADADNGYSSVHHQPENPTETRKALQALLCCPTGSIGDLAKHDLTGARSNLPMYIDGDVYYCGYNSPKSYGGNSYFVKYPEGNWLIDSPKFLTPLVRSIEEMGGISRIFLTHRDDVADADRYAAHFGAKRIIHRRELSSQPGAEIVLDGASPVRLADDFLVIPTFGHTSGHCVLLYKNRYLFTGDHLWWSRNRKSLSAGRDVCWWDWTEQIASTKKLLDHDFEWVLPGHGEKVHLSVPEIKMELKKLALRMEK